MTEGVALEPVLDRHSQAIMGQYQTALPVFESMQALVMKELHGVVKDLDMRPMLFESRVKTEKSLAGKLELKGHKYRSLSDVTDIFGARIVTLYNDEVYQVAEAVEKIFDIDWDNTVDKSKLLSPDQVGYMSLHYICRVPASLYCDPDLPQLNSFRFELQMRTALQHAWASIVHDSGYKSDVEIPVDLIRGLNRMSALLEIADDNFHQLRDDIDSYREHARSQIRHLRFDEAKLDGETFANYLELHPFDDLNRRIAAITGAEIEERNLSYYLPALRGLGCATIGEVDRMFESRQEDAYLLARDGLEGTDIDILSSSIALQNVCIAQVVRCGWGVGGLKRLFELTTIGGSTAARRAERTMRRAEKLGIVPELGDTEADPTSESPSSEGA